MTNNSDNYSINATLMRFEGRLAVLYAQDCGEIRWPLSSLPDSTQIGDSITLEVALAGQQQPEEKYVHMKRLLEELIN